MTLWADVTVMRKPQGRALHELDESTWRDDLMKIAICADTILDRIKHFLWPDVQLITSVTLAELARASRQQSDKKYPLKVLYIDIVYQHCGANFTRYIRWYFNVLRLTFH